MANNINEGDRVKWEWANGSAKGTVKSVFEKTVTRKPGGSEVTREGTKENHALYIQSDDDDNNNVLKLASEVSKL